MAISSNYSFNMDLHGVVKNAMQKAGILGADERPDASEVAMGGEWLNLLLKNWQAGARHVRYTERRSATLVNGQPTVSLDPDTVDVEFPCNVTLATSGTYTTVERMTLDEYMHLSDPHQTGIPSRMLIERKEAITGTLWPVPDTSLATTLNYVKVRLVRDADPGTNPDVHQRALLACVLGLAVEFAEWAGKGDTKIARLESRYREAKADLESDSTEKGDIELTIGGF